MIRRLFGLGALVLLLGPASCLTDVGPKPFSTRDSCQPGDIEGCVCSTKGGEEPGVRGCGPDNTFSSTSCRCPVGCTVFPDCSKCPNSCFEKCMCHTFARDADACRATCDADGSSTSSVPSDVDSGESQRPLR